jgi:hypothetical protein
MPDVEPSAAEDPRFLFLVEIRVDEDLAADFSRGRIDQGAR